MAGDRLVASSLRFTRDGKGIIDDSGQFAAAVATALLSLPGGDESGDLVLCASTDPEGGRALYWQQIVSLEGEADAPPADPPTDEGDGTAPTGTDTTESTGDVIAASDGGDGGDNTIETVEPAVVPTDESTVEPAAEPTPEKDTTRAKSKSTK